MVVFQMIIAVPVRLALDVAVGWPRFAWFKPYTVPVVILFVVGIWVFGIIAVFGRTPRKGEER